MKLTQYWFSRSYFLPPPSLWESSKSKHRILIYFPQTNFFPTKAGKSSNKVHFLVFMKHFQSSGPKILRRRLEVASRRSLWGQKYKCFSLPTHSLFTGICINRLPCSFALCIKKMTGKSGYVHEVKYVRKHHIMLSETKKKAYT